MYAANLGFEVTCQILIDSIMMNFDVKNNQNDGSGETVAGKVAL